MAGRAVLGTIATESLAKVCHMISSGCHVKLGLEDNRPMPWGEMLLAVLAAAGRDGLSITDVLTEAAVIAADLMAESDAVLARAADDGMRTAATSEG